jgi:hypothetical protein
MKSERPKKPKREVAKGDAAPTALQPSTVGAGATSDDAPPAAHPAALPEHIPAAWLEDIKGALKQSRWELILTLVLGSSVLTGVATSLVNYYFIQPGEYARKKREELSSETRQAYKTLGEELDNYYRAVDDAEGTFRILCEAPQSPIADQAPGNLSALSDQQIVLRNRLGDSHIQGDTQQIVNEVLHLLGSKLSSVAKFKEMPEDQRDAALKDFYETLVKVRDTDIPAIRKHILDVRNALIDHP